MEKYPHYATKKGYCWSKNKYFAELYGVSQTSVSKWISSLADKGYIFVKIIYREGTKQILNRYLSLVKDPIEEKFNTPLRKVKDPIEEKLNSPIEEKLKENNTVKNNTINIPSISPKGEGEDKNNPKTTLMERFETFYKAYPKHKSRGTAEKAWRTLKPTDELLAKIMKALETAKKSSDWTKDNGQYIPYPATWLRAKGWEDETEKTDASKKLSTYEGKGEDYLC